MKLNFISILNVLILLALILPESLHIKRTIKNRKKHTHQAPVWISLIELVSRLVCMILMILPISIKEFHFESNQLMLMYLIGSIAFLAVYLMIYYFYFSNEKLWSGMLLAVIPIIILMNTAYTLNYFILAVFTFIYGFTHIFLAFLRHI